jgi:DNA polymerase elongation subunit (family B)
MLYRKFSFGERESYKLEAIAQEHLPELPKLSYDGSLASLYKDDFNHFLAYNIRDSVILLGFEKKLGYVSLAAMMYQSNTALFENVTGTVRVTDYAIYNYCKHVAGGLVVPDIDDSTDKTVELQGAFVLEPKQGLHKYIGSVDVTSLYPSCIRSVNISPEMVIGQFLGEEKDAIEIAAGSDARLAFKDEATGKTIVDTAANWRAIFDEHRCAVSGFGTVFSLERQGLIPSVIENWFNQRLEVNAQIKQLEAKVVEWLATNATRIP